MHILVLRKGVSIVTITQLHENIWPKKKRKKMYSYHVCRGRNLALEKAGASDGTSTGGTHAFIFFAFIVYCLHQSNCVYITTKGGLPRSEGSFYSLKCLVLYFTRPFKAVQLALVIAYL